MEQNWTNPYKNISLTPYRLIAAGGGHSKAVLPDGTLMGASDLKRQLKYPQLFAWNAERKELDNWNKYLQENIMLNISSFLKELGNGFSFIDNEYKIKIGNNLLVKRLCK